MELQPILRTQHEQPTRNRCRDNFTNKRILEKWMRICGARTSTGEARSNEEIPMIRKFFKDESGVTMIEYGLIAALVGVACVVVLTTLGGDLQTLFGNVSTAVNP